MIDIDATKSEEGGPLVNVLAKKAAEARAKKRQPITLKVPNVPSVTIRYSTLVPYDVKNRWSKITDGLTYAVAVVATQCEAILVDGEEVRDNGELVTFRSKKFADEFGALTPTEAIEILFGGLEKSGYSDIDLHAVKIFEAAGLGPREGDVEVSPLG